MARIMSFIKSPLGLLLLLLVLLWLFSQWRRGDGVVTNLQRKSEHTSYGGPRAAAPNIAPTSAAVEGWTP